ncbi:MAG: phage tail assembly chaperone [Hyphomicrobiaceae bacterium]|nr:phage tail assembly chaperone [Hyphomicrobiaceae bacterium]
MAAGLGILRLGPADFWTMTPRELAAALEGAFGRASAAPAPSRDELSRLVERYPDQH